MKTKAPKRKATKAAKAKTPSGGPVSITVVNAPPPRTKGKGRRRGNRPAP